MDQEHLLQFFEESEELLNCAVNEAIQLKSEPDNKKLIHSIFRILHSIKGNSSILGFSGIKNLTHSIEEVLNLIREDKIRVDHDVSSLLVRGIDDLKKFIENIKNNAQETNGIKKYQKVFDKEVKKIIKVNSQDISMSWFEMTAKIMELKELNTAEESIRDWEQLIGIMDTIGERLITSNIISVNLLKTEKLNPKAEIEKILRSYGEDDIDELLSAKILNNLKLLAEQTTENTRHFVGEAIGVFEKVVSVEGFTGFLADVIAEKLQNVKLNQNLSEDKSLSSLKGGISLNKTMRVNELKIDELFNLAGEFINIGEIYEHIEKDLNSQLSINRNFLSLKKNNETFNALSLQLQDKLSKIKRVSLQNLIRSAHRIVYDINLSGEKKVKVIVEGENILIDKGLLERLEHPFIHLVRNAADHGIENVEERKNSDKKEEGTVKIIFSENKKNLNICITDDGKGINRDSVLSKAIEKKILSPDFSEPMTDDQIYKLLFKPGFSTLNESNELSGRGVGLDVVNREILALGGEIFIESVEEKGTSITVCVPKKFFITIMDGLIVKSAGQKFILPVSSIRESIKITEDKIISLPGCSECVKRDENVYKIIRLDKFLGVSKSFKVYDKEKIGVVVMNERAVEFILMVDDIVGIRQIVLKDIDGLANKPDYLYGAAVLGNGNIALVIDLKKIKGGCLA